MLVDVRPSGSHSVADYHGAGGVTATLKALESLLDLEARGVAGGSLGEVLKSVSKGNLDIISDIRHPLHPEGAFAVLKGSLAPDGAVFKQSASGSRRFRGRAKVFESEEVAGEAILAGGVSPGDVMVVRGSGPVGAPGMPCLYGSVWLLKSMGLDDKVALVTDGRLSGTIRGLAVAHVSPEAGDGGPIALVRDGDEIAIDVEARRLDLLVPVQEMKRREVQLKRAEQETSTTGGLLGQYRRLVGPAHKGAVLTASGGDITPRGGTRHG
jgi:dihydroxy-acid dehydratase